MKNPYEVLGVSPTASEDDIKRAYRLLAMKWHPDRNPNNRAESELLFKEIGRAYSILSDPVERQRYDEAGAGEDAAFDHMRDEFSSDDAFSTFLAAVLDLAFEMALRDERQIAIYRALVAEGCPENIARTVASRAHAMANRHSSGGAAGGPSVHEREAPGTAHPKRQAKPFGNGGPLLAAAPWARFFARTIDLGVVTALVFSAGVAMQLSLPTWTLGALPAALLGFLVFGIALLAYDAIALPEFGTTIGKAVFGLRIKREQGGLLDTESAFRRAFWAWASGNGCYLAFPGASVFFWWRGYKALKTTGSTPWDKRARTTVEQREIGSFRFLLGASLSVFLLMGTMVFAALNKQALKQELTADINQFDRLYVPQELTNKPAAPNAAATEPGTVEALARSERMKSAYAANDYHGVIQESESGPFWSTELQYLGAAYSAIGNKERAVGAFRDAEKAFPQDSTAKCNYAESLYSIGQYDVAIAKFREGLQLNSSNQFCREKLHNAERLLAAYKSAAASEAKRLEQDRRLAQKRADAERAPKCVIRRAMTDEDIARCRAR